MKKITIDFEKCEGCGCCEEHLPDIRKTVCAWGNEFIVNENNKDFDINRAYEAQKFCHSRSFMVVDI